RVALATGRIQVDAKRFAEQAGLTDFVADGGHSITVNNELVSMIGMDRDACIKYLEYLESHNIPWAVTDRNKLGRITPYKEILEWHPNWDVFKTTVDPNFDFHSVEEFYKIYVFFKEGEEEEKDIEHMTHKLIRYGDGCVLYEPMEKALGIRNMLEHFGMKPNQAVVFGDGYNDLSMFRPEWLNIAMGNARPELKAKADYITTDCDKDGIYNACKHFKWID
ncbi:MAG: HAD family hydrolase, partial [Veillonella parvula]|nr:HAD family hydrolase [Veillonella parvula]